jgi:hypothetical protein
MMIYLRVLAYSLVEGALPPEADLPPADTLDLKLCGRVRVPCHNGKNFLSLNIYDLTPIPYGSPSPLVNKMERGKKGER